MQSSLKELNLVSIIKMNLITPKYEIVEQKYDDLLNDMFKHIERCGRICYKSDDKITEESYQKFVERLEKSNHGAMLEHGTVYLTIPIGTPINDDQYICKKDIVKFFKQNKYSVVNEKTINQKVDIDIKGYGMKAQASATFYFITTNWRVIIENHLDWKMKYGDFEKDLVLQWMTKPMDEHEKRYTVIFTCDIGVTREFNRHRVDSIAEESTRYCNYSKDKFGGELNIVKPVWISDVQYASMGYDIFQYCYDIEQHKDTDNFIDIDYWLFGNLACEYSYMNLIRLGWTPQQARTILPLDTKSTLVHTTFAKDWIHFFDLRAIGTTGQPHPSAKELALPLMQEFIKRKYIQ